MSNNKDYRSVLNVPNMIEANPDISELQKLQVVLKSSRILWKILMYYICLICTTFVLSMTFAHVASNRSTTVVFLPTSLISRKIQPGIFTITFYGLKNLKIVFCISFHWAFGLLAEHFKKIQNDHNPWVQKLKFLPNHLIIPIKHSLSYTAKLR